MDNDTKKMLKKVTIYDAVILILTFAISFVIFREYTIAVILGLVVALVNFLLNAVLTTYSFNVTGKRSLMLLGTLVRILVTAAIAVILFVNNLNNLIAFLIGYSLHYIAVILYGITRANKIERK